MMRKRVVDEPQNLNHNVVPKRAEIGRLTAVNTTDAHSDGDHSQLAPWAVRRLTSDYRWILDKISGGDDD